MLWLVRDQITKELKHKSLLVFAIVLAMLPACNPAHGQSIVTGMNLVNEPNKQTVPEQDAT
jgi:hypothetical protein